MKINPITLEVLGNLFASVAEEMGTALCRSALSPNIKERRDFSCIVCDRRGEMIAQAAHIPVHLGSAPLSVRAAVDEQDPGPGDVVILNDPFRGGTHLPDITMVMPVFLSMYDESAAFYVANRAHHADVGGMSPGSMPVSDEIFQEGVVIPPLKVKVRGELNGDLVSMFLANVRTPREREGDLQAQIASLEIGARRLKEIVDREGREKTDRYADALKDHSERIMRSVIAEAPDGVYTAEDFLEDDGFSDKPARIAVRLTIEGDEATVDFTDSSDQVQGNLNAVEAITLSAALYVFRLLVPDEIPATAGTLRPLHIRTRPGSVVNAVSPAAVAGGNVETSQRIVDVLLAALANALPNRIPAGSQGTMNNLTIGSTDRASGAPFAYYETIGGGLGAGPDGPGASGVHCHMTNTMNTPVEALESAYPLLVERYELRRDSGGPGTYYGGDGIRRDVRLLRAATVSIISERRKSAPYGLAGGLPGARGRNFLIKADGTEIELQSKVSFRADVGDTISVRSPGGGGWGSPT